MQIHQAAMRGGGRIGLASAGGWLLMPFRKNEFVWCKLVFVCCGAQYTSCNLTGVTSDVHAVCCKLWRTVRGVSAVHV
eukprot:6012503-Pyramimonas_sp.AAC.1